MPSLAIWGRDALRFSMFSLLVTAGLATGVNAEEVSQRGVGTQSPAAAAREARVAARLAADPGGIPTLADWGAGLPAFDVRYEGAAVTENDSPARAALEKWRGTAAFAARQAEALKLSTSGMDLRIDDHDLFGTPQFVRSTRAFLTPATPGASAADVVGRYVHDHAALFEIDALEIPAAKVTREYITAHNGVTHLTFQQMSGGLELIGCLVKANVMRDGRLINISSSMLPRPAGGFAVGTVKLNAADAVVAAARHAGVSLTSRPVVLETKPGAAERTTWAHVPELRPDEPVMSERVLFPVSREEIRPAFRVTIPVPGAGHTYDVVVDAVDGSLLTRHNRLVSDSTQPVTMRVYTSDGVAPMSPGLAAPAATQAPLATRNLVTVNPADVIAYSPNGWIDDGNTETVGNNVDAHLDLDANNVADTPRPNGGASRVFDFALDPSQAPQTYRDAAVTQMFYFANRFHDRLYALGFDEVASNFQTNNFGRGGSGNDAVQADVHDGNGTGANTNNANFNTTGADGSSARVQMYIFTGPTPDRDGGLDGDIVYHELGHGVSIRLLGGITTLQPRGMGEGWSDFFGFTMLAEPTDDPTATYVTGGYTTYQLGVSTYTSNYYYGIRRFPYSIDLTKNPLTFADIDPAQYQIAPGVPISPLVNVAISASANEVHNIGEVWCMALLEARSQLWARDGFSANQLMMQLVVDGLKLAPGEPTFVQARDAVLQADLVNNASANLVPLWTAFAKRGLGAAASASSSNSAAVVESYVTPFRVDFTYPDGLPSQLTPGQPTTFRVKLNPVLLTLSSGDVSLNYSVNGGATTSAALTPTGVADEYFATLPALPCFSTVRFSIRTGTSLGDRFDPAAPSTHAAQVFTGATQVLFDNFESSSGWTVGPNTATGGIWTRVDPVGTAAAPEDDHTPAPATICYVSGNGAVGGAVGAADVDGGSTILNSPTFDLAAYSDVRVSYWRWYSNGTGAAPYADTLKVEASNNNGASWVPAETVGPLQSADTMPGWRFASWRLSSLGLAPTSQVRVRFIADDLGSGSIVEAGIDDFAIERIECVEPPSCAADFNGSGDVSVQDIFDFLAAYFSGAGTADVNNSGDITVQDIFDFLAVYFAGCP